MIFQGKIGENLKNCGFFNKIPKIYDENVKFQSPFLNRMFFKNQILTLSGDDIRLLGCGSMDEPDTDTIESKFQKI